MVRMICLLIVLLCQQSLAGNGNGNGSTPYLENVFSTNLAGVRLQTEGDPFASPVWELGSNNAPLVLHFDDLEGGYRPYTVRLVPCRRDWTPSDLFESQAFEGLDRELIQEHRPSFNTLQRYTHYSHPLPSETLRPKISGNFAVLVYADQDLQDLVLVRRLLVLENRVSVAALVRRTYAGRQALSHQQLELDLTPGRLTIQQPVQDLSLHVLQNGDWNSLRSVPPFPTLLGPQQWTYRAVNELEFPGGNEYRAVDLRTVRAPSRGVERIVRTVDGYEAWVQTDPTRGNGPHLSQKDLNGRSLIQNFEQRVPHTESEYVWTTFSLEPGPGETMEGVYLQMDLGYPACDETMAMEWQAESGLWVKSLYLKQGFYDYRYLTGPEPCSAVLLEGSHADTENDYEVLVYYHPPAGMAYDRLVGYTKINSMGQKSR